MEARRYIPQYTLAEYEQWEGDWELWQGIPVAMSPSPRADHQRILLSLAMQLQSQFEQQERCQFQTYVELDWRISNDTVVRPDISVVCERLQGDFMTHSPELIIEISSPGTADKDRHAKRTLYAAQGVKHYLIVEAEASSATHFVGDGSGNYLDAIAVGRCDFELHETCTVTLDLAGLFSD